MATSLHHTDETLKRLRDQCVASSCSPVNTSHASHVQNVTAQLNQFMLPELLWCVHSNVTALSCIMLITYTMEVYHFQKDTHGCGNP